MASCLYEADVIDTCGSDEERRAARLLDTGSHWTQVPAEKIEKACYLLHFMDEKGFRYCLPTLMVCALTQAKTSNSATVDHTIYALDPCGSPAGRLAGFDRLSPDQKRAIAAVLEYMAGEDMSGHVDAVVARRALEGYWRDWARGHDLTTQHQFAGQTFGGFSGLP